MDGSLASKIQAANSALIGTGNLDAVGEYFAPDFVAHLTEREMKGHAGVRRFLSMLDAGFPDLEAKVEVLLEGEDRVAWQRTLQGTHQADFMGFPATGRRVVWRDMVTSRFRDGLFAEDWAISDLAE